MPVDKDAGITYYCNRVSPCFSLSSTLKVAPMMTSQLYLMVDRYVPHARMLSSSPFMAISTSSLLSVHSSLIRPLSSSIFTSTTVGLTQTSVTASPARACASRNLKTVFCAWAPTAQPTTRAIIRNSFSFSCPFVIIC